jgi:nitrate/TMAO reductase-like tetraheme cytochrome c subunit
MALIGGTAWMSSEISPLGIATLTMAAIAALLLLHHLLFRPPLTTATRIRLLLGLGIFPAATATLNTAEGMHRTSTREFCGSCHVMEKHLADVNDLSSTSLAARHGRNSFIGESNCYSCHANYGMNGYPLTKLTALKHVYMYYFAGYRRMPLERAVSQIKISKPYPNSNCVQCHSGRLESWRNVREHAAAIDDIEAGRVACASAGCHGYSHPFNKETEPEHAAR